jgi:hypothetical protein
VKYGFDIDLKSAKSLEKLIGHERRPSPEELFA